MPSVHVHLIRHGQSTWNREGRLQGQAVHPGLTALGQSQAGSAAAILAGVVDGPAALWSSDLVRAAQTAEVVGRRLGLPVQHDDALREQGLGALEGRLTRELRAEPVPEGVDVGDVRWGGGESTADVHARVGRFLARELPTAPSHLVLVSHGDTIRAARAWLLSRSHRDLDWDDIGNGSVVSVPWG